MDDMEAIVAVAAPLSDFGASSMVEAALRTPSYPNWQRKRIQNPYSVSSNLTEGTTPLIVFALTKTFPRRAQITVRLAALPPRAMTRRCAVIGG